MKLLAFSIYDEKSETFSNPFFTAAIGLASRTFSDLANDINNMIGKHPTDFKLYHVGYWFDDQAKFDSSQVPILIGSATDYIAHNDEFPRSARQMEEEKSA